MPPLLVDVQSPARAVYNIDPMTGATIPTPGSSQASPSYTTPAQRSAQLLGTVGGAGATLANGAQSTAVAVSGGSYIWAYQFSGTTTLTLQTLGPDGVTWTALTPTATATATGAQGVVIGDNPSMVPNVRVANTGANPATLAFSSLS